MFLKVVLSDYGKVKMKKVTQSFLDSYQYQRHEIEKYETIYGRHFISPGGKETTQAFLDLVSFSPEMNVLDIGCGLGGAAFLMAQKYGVRVDGIDLSANMLQVAQERCQEEGVADRVTFTHGDCLEMEQTAVYNFIHSRDVFLHIEDKQRLFQIIFRALKPGGTVLFTDYCRAAGQPSISFAQYIAQQGYHLCTVPEYHKLLTDGGFTDAVARDETEQFIQIHERELANLSPNKLSQADFDELHAGWQAKIGRATQGEQRWGLFIAKK